MSRTVAIFDWDGVVIDSSTAHEQSWEALAQEERLPLPADHFKRGFGKRNEVIIPHILAWTQDPAEIRRLSYRKEALYRDIARQGHIRLLPGARELTTQLKALGIPCVIGTSTQKENLQLSFELFNLHGLFQGAISSEDVQHGKPDPEVFLKACALAQGNPQTSFVFEDSFAGIEAGLRGGFNTIALATTNSADQLIPTGAHRIIPDLTGVDPAWLVAGGLR